MTEQAKAANLSPKGRLSYAWIFTPKTDAKKGTKKYQTVLIFDEAAQKTPEFKNMVAAAEAKRTEAFGAKAKSAKLPWRNGNEGDKADLEGYGPGTIYINVSSTQKPDIRDERKQPITDETQLGSGDYARISWSVYGYDTDGNRGVSFGLRNIQRLGRGEPLGSRSDADADFDAVETTADSTDVDNLFR